MLTPDVTRLREIRAEFDEPLNVRYPGDAFTRRIFIGILDALLAPPDGAAEREPMTDDEARRIGCMPPSQEPFYRALCRKLNERPTPAPGEAPGAAEPLFQYGEESTPAGKAFLDWISLWSKPIDRASPAAGMWAGFKAGWNAALPAASPAAPVTEEMVEAAAAQIWRGEQEKLGLTNERLDWSEAISLAKDRPADNHLAINVRRCREDAKRALDAALTGDPA
jgi:hypothetical protein